MKKYDVIIVGAGPAGMTAGIFASRRELKTLIVTDDIGGQMLSTTNIENYPGFKKIEALELVKRLEDHVRHFGVEIVRDVVTGVKQTGEKEFTVFSKKNKYKSKAVILAFGKSPRALGVPGEKEFSGKGVSYCANCDGPMFKKMPVAVVGGGNSAFESAHYMAKIASKVYLIHRRNEFRAFESLVKQVKKLGVEFILNTEVKEMKGDKFLKSLVLEDVNTHKRRELQVSGVFIEIGSEVKSEIIKDLVKLDESNHVVIDDKCQTFYPNSNKIRPGVFAAGDITSVPFKQIIISAGEGAKAALQAYNYIHDIETKGIVADWSTQH